MPKRPWSTNLVNWYLREKRPMPWRDHPTPYAVWISEMMLQQTQVDTVIPYFNRFLRQFPTVNALANADLQSVLKVWEGLGYYSRARNLHKAAKMVVDTFNGELPSDYRTLMTLPGIGPYIAAAITSIAFGNPIPVVDGNVLRVFTRFWGIDADILKPATRNDLFARLTPVIGQENPSHFNQAMMELGAMICSPTKPDCQRCPLKPECYAANHDAIDQFPVKKAKAPVPHHRIAVGVIWDGDCMLIGRRKESGMLGGLWEFPGGKLQSNETEEAAVVREVKEETGLVVRPGTKYCAVRHAYSHFTITISAYACTIQSGSATPISADELQWVTIDELDQYPFPTANKKIIAAIRNAHYSEKKQTSTS